MVADIRIRAGDAPRLKAALLGLLTAAAMTPMENGQMLVHTLYRAPEVFPALWSGSHRGGRAWKKVAKALVKVYEAVLQLEAALAEYNQAPPAPGGAPGHGPPPAPPIPLPGGAMPHAAQLALVPPFVPQAVPAPGAGPDTTTSASATRQGMAFLSSLLLHAVEDSPVLQILIVIYRGIYFLLTKMAVKTAIGTVMSLGLLSLLMFALDPALILRAMFYLIKLIPGYLYGLSEAFGHEIAAQVGLISPLQHCAYEAAQAASSNGFATTGANRWEPPTQPTPAPPPFWASTVTAAMMGWIFARLGH